MKMNLRGILKELRSEYVFVIPVVVVLGLLSYAVVLAFTPIQPPEMLVDQTSVTDEIRFSVEIGE